MFGRKQKFVSLLEHTRSNGGELLLHVDRIICLTMAHGLGLHANAAPLSLSVFVSGDFHLLPSLFFSFLLQAITTPAMAVSHIMLESYKKYILVSLILLGKVQQLPKYTSQIVGRFVKVRLQKSCTGALLFFKAKL